MYLESNDRMNVKEKKLNIYLSYHIANTHTLYIYIKVIKANDTRTVFDILIIFNTSILAHVAHIFSLFWLSSH